MALLLLATVSVARAESSSPPLPGASLVTVGSPLTMSPTGTPSLGAVPPGQTITVSIALSLPGASGETSYLDGLSDPSSPNFHHYLSLTQFAASFGPSPAARASLFGYLGSYGLTPAAEGGPLLYTFSGTAGALEAAFHVQLDEYDVAAGMVGWAPTSQPRLPAGPASVVESISGLDQFDRPQPTLLTAGPATTLSVTTPTVMRGFYNATTLLGEGDNGSLWAIGLSEMCDPLQKSTAVLSSDLASFDSLYGLPAPPHVYYTDTGATSCTSGYPGWAEETDLDMQWAHAMAPGATLYVCLDNSDPDNCDQEFVANHTVDNIEFGSNSYIWITSDHSVWASAVAAGMTLLASSGDKCATQGVGYPAEEPDGLGVGGTTITPNGNSFGSEAAWSCTGSGNSAEGGAGGCDSSDAPPSYQTLMSGYPGVCTSSERGVPDVSMEANPNTGVDIYYAGVLTTGVGGTSLASPMWAASLDDIYQAANAGGFAAPEVYALAESANYSRLFHDITSGSCGGVYATTAGWSPCTGVGSPDIGALATAWPSGGGPGPRSTVSFSIVSAGDGAIDFGGSTVYSGGSVSVPSGNYTIAPIANAWARFSGWSVAGGLTLTTGATKVYVHGSGTLTLAFTPLSSIAFTVAPTTCALTVNGSTPETSGSTGTFLPSPTFALSANPCSGYAFSSWAGGGGVAPASSSANPTTADVAGNGSLSATYTSAATFTVSIQLSPVGDGSVLLQGQPYYNGATVSLPAGSYPASAVSAPWAAGGHLAASGGITLSGGQITLSGAGTLSASFTPLASVSFTVSPTPCAPVYFNGSSPEGTGSGTQALVATGAYALNAPACAGEGFENWSASPSLSVASPLSDLTTVTVDGNGSLLATYGHPVLYAITVSIDPSACGPVSVGGDPYASGATAELEAGAYPVSAAACSGYESVPGFTATGGASLNGAGTTLTVVGAGSLSVAYTPLASPLSATLAGPSSATTGEAATFNASWSGGTSPYSLLWLWGDGTTPFSQSDLSDSLAESHVYGKAGAYTLRLFVNGSSGGSASSTWTVTVHAASTPPPSNGTTAPAAGTGGLTLTDWALLLVAVAAAVVVALVVISRRRSGRPPPEGSDLGYVQGYPESAFEDGAFSYSDR